MQMDFNEINELLFRLLDNEISDADFARLTNWLDSHSDAKLYYYHFMSDFGLMLLRKATSISVDSDDSHLDLTETGSDDSQTVVEINVSLREVELSELNLDEESDDSKDNELTQEMPEVPELDKNSSAVEIPKEEPKRELIQKVESDFKLFPVRPSKCKLLFLAAMAASIIVTIGYPLFFGPKDDYRPVVAVLSESINAQWDDSFAQPDEFGDMVQSRYRLKKGLITILFNEGAKVTVEAPAELSLNSGDDVELFSGRVYAFVPDRAHGFKVKAGNSKIVDLGTEFGLEVDTSGNTQLHVTKGSTMLFARSAENLSSQIEVKEGSAMKVYNDGFVKDIDVTEDIFVRGIDSKTGLVFTRPNKEAIYEPFDYGGVNLHGQFGSSEIGLTGRWSAHLPRPMNPQNFLNERNLTFGGLPTRGGSIKTDFAVNAKRFGGSRSIDPEALAGSGLLKSGATVWFSVLIGLGDSSPGLKRKPPYLGFALASDSFKPDNAGPELKAGEGIGVYLQNSCLHAAGYSASGVMAATEKSPACKIGQYNLVVCKIKWGDTDEAEDTIEVYMPDEDLILPSAPVSTLKTRVDQSAFETLTFCICDIILLDEIRFGKSYSDVLGNR